MTKTPHERLVMAVAETVSAPAKTRRKHPVSIGKKAVMDWLEWEIAQSADNIRISIAGSRPFLVDRGTILPSVSAVREALQQLCLTYISDKATSNRRTEALRTLAIKSEHLNLLLFSNAGTTYATKLKKPHWSRKPWFFKIDQNVQDHIPWGLLFGVPGEQTDITSLSDKEICDNFWCVAHCACAAYTGNIWDELHNPPILTLSLTSTFAAFHKEVFRYVSSAVDDADASTLWQHASISYRFNDLASKAKMTHSDLLIYFFCHASENNLFLDGNEKVEPTQVITPQDISAWSLTHRSGLFFLNGCHTALEPKPNAPSWLKATRDNDFLGFIGTETVVPSLFAWTFGHAFLRLILADNLTPIQAMTALRSVHWPLHLLYGLYCTPELRIRATIIPSPANDHTAQTPPAMTINLCNQPLINKHLQTHACCTLPLNHYRGV